MPPPVGYLAHLAAGGQHPRLAAALAEAAPSGADERFPQLLRRGLAGVLAGWTGGVGAAPSHRGPKFRPGVRAGTSAVRVPRRATGGARTGGRWWTGVIAGDDPKETAMFPSEETSAMKDRAA